MGKKAFFMTRATMWIIISVLLFFVTGNIFASFLDVSNTQSGEIDSFISDIDDAPMRQTRSFIMHNVPPPDSMVVFIEEVEGDIVLSPESVEMILDPDNLFDVWKGAFGQWGINVIGDAITMYKERELSGLPLHIDINLEVCAEGTSCICALSRLDGTEKDGEEVVMAERTTCRELPSRFKTTEISVLLNLEFEGDMEHSDFIEMLTMYRGNHDDEDLSGLIEQDGVRILVNNVEGRRSMQIYYRKFTSDGEESFVVCFNRYMCEMEEELLSSSEESGVEIPRTGEAGQDW